MGTVARSHPIRQNGFSLVELLVVIVVLGIAAGTLTMVSTRSAELSAQMLHEQQALTLANALLDEVVAMPFTYCDPNDGAAATATSAAGCSQPEVMGPEPGETRLGASRFDNVNDYNNLSIAATALRDAANNPMVAELPTVANCSLNVTVTPVGFNGIAASESQRVTVAVSCPGQLGPIATSAVRVRYAPNRAQF